MRVLLGSLLWLALALQGAQQAMAAGSPTLAAILERGAVRIGMSGDQPPLNALDQEGRPIGFEVDMANAMAQAMGVKLELEIIPFSGLLDSLEQGDIDMVISGMSITTRRASRVAFVGPYMMSGKSLLTIDEELAKTDQPEQLDKDGLRLAALRNSTSQIFVERMAPGASLALVDDYDVAIQSLLAGDIDALVADMPSCILATMRFPGKGLKTLDAPLSVEPIGIAVRGDDVLFQRLADNYLETLSRVGFLARIRGRWFVETDWLESLPPAS